MSYVGIMKKFFLLSILFVGFAGGLLAMEGIETDFLGRPNYMGIVISDDEYRQFIDSEQHNVRLGIADGLGMLLSIEEFEVENKGTLSPSLRMGEARKAWIAIGGRESLPVQSEGDMRKVLLAMRDDNPKLLAEYMRFMGRKVVAKIFFDWVGEIRVSCFGRPGEVRPDPCCDIPFEMDDYDDERLWLEDLWERALDIYESIKQDDFNALVESLEDSACALSEISFEGSDFVLRGVPGV